MYLLLSILFMVVPLHASLHLNLITPDKKPTGTLLALLSVCNIKHDGSLSSIITATEQEQPHGLVRPKNKERWQTPTYLTDKKDTIHALCTLLGMFHAIEPVGNTYDYIVLFGGTITGIRTRLAFLLQLWQKGIRSKKIIVLTGQRLLDPTIESKAVLVDTNNGILPCKKEWKFDYYPRTETEMIQVLFEQAILPSSLQAVPIIFIDTPAQQKNGGLIRPNTADTIYHWLATSPIPGSVLAISEQPSIGYQDILLRRYMPASFTIETVGPVVSQEHLLAPEILVGTVGWWLYHTLLFMKEN